MLVARAAERVEPERAGRTQLDLGKGSGGWLHREVSGSVVGAGRQPNHHARDARHQDQADHRRDQAVANSKRDAALGLRRECPQDARHLARSAPSTGGLDRKHVLEVGDQLRIVRVAVLLDPGREGRGNLRTAHLDVGQLLAHVLHRHRHLAVALERNFAGEHLVEHDPQRVEVRLARDRLAERLLGGDVVGRAQDAAVRR